MCEWERKKEREKGVNFIWFGLRLVQPKLGRAFFISIQTKRTLWRVLVSSGGVKERLP
ncbi:hypothetical protein LINPERHAP2_LOCUS14030 [Linum perenne]